jgi:hypothetical protein
VAALDCSGSRAASPLVVLAALLVAGGASRRSMLAEHATAVFARLQKRGRERTTWQPRSGAELTACS